MAGNAHIRKGRFRHIKTNSHNSFEVLASHLTQTIIPSDHNRKPPNLPPPLSPLCRPRGALLSLSAIQAARIGPGEEDGEVIVRKLRLERGLTQDQLATMAGISIRTLQRVERGGEASAESLKCIAAVLDLPFADLRKDPAMHDPSQPYTGTDLPELTPEEREALEYVRDIKGFYIHAGNYAIVILALFAFNMWTMPHGWWVIWVALGWGLGLAYHGLSVFEVFHPFSDKWELAQMRKRLARTETSRTPPRSS